MSQNLQPSLRSVLVLGARGRFGRAAVQAFAESGWQVFAQMRPGGQALDIPGVRWLAVAPRDTAALADAARGATVVVQALSPTYTHKAWRDEVPALTQAAIDITRALGATMLLPASVYNFGSGMPERLHEDTPQNPTTFKGRMRVRSEAMVRAATQDGRMKAVIIRGGDFFGSGTGSWFDLVMTKAVRNGKLTYPGPMDVPTAWAYLPDMARSFVKVAEHRHALPAFETLHFAGYRLTGQKWADAMAGVAWERGWLPAKGRLQVSSVSWLFMRAVGLFVPTVAALCEMRYLWRTPHALVNTRMATLIGEEPHTPFAEALRTSLDELGFGGPSVVEPVSRAVAPAAEAHA
ncbi:MAG: NAD-dependent epimerase/dehydratase family protein [Polaromonas sp.]|uniref:NAD-dependent epimerase/dehydratase family protein n=1 Tax=Polaromonas sp. TaxID=1869339 RepID=UPI003267E0FC